MLDIITLHLGNHFTAYLTLKGAWWLICRFVVFRTKGRMFESRYPPHRDLGQVLHSQLPVALRRETPTHSIRAVSEAPLSIVVHMFATWHTYIRVLVRLFLNKG